MQLQGVLLPDFWKFTKLVKTIIEDRNSEFYEAAAILESTNVVRGHYLLTHFWTDKVTLTVESGAFS